MTQRYTLFGLLPAILLLSACRQDPQANQKAEAAAADSLFLQYNAIRTDKAIDAAEKIRLNQELLSLYGDTGDSLEFALLKHRTNMHWNLGQLDSAQFYSRRLLERAQATRDSLNMADAYFHLGFYYRLTDDYTPSLEAYYRAVGLYKSLGDSVNAGRKLLNLANLLNQEGNFYEAERLAVEGLEQLGPPTEANGRYVSGLYNALAITSMKTRHFSEALSWYDKALMISRDTMTNFRYRTNVATVYIKQQEYARARDTLEAMAADPFWDSGAHPTDLARILDKLGWAKSNLGEADAERLLQEGLRLREEAGFKRGILESYLHLAEHYSRNDLERAKRMAYRAYDLARELGFPDDRINALTLLIQVGAAPREYAMELKRVSDSLYGAREQGRVNFARIRFETDQLRRNYEASRRLNTQKELQLLKARIMSASLLALLVVLGVLVYLYYRLNQKNIRQKRLEASLEAEDRISRKVHDVLANDLFNIMNYASQEPLGSENAQKHLIGQLDRVYAKSRNIARESAPTSKALDFSQELKGLADSYNSEDTRILLKGIEKFPWGRLEDLGKAACYRVLQELLVNMKKHSGATLVLLEFTRPGRWLQVRYRDNGVGLAQEKPLQRNGLENAEDRIRALGGSFAIASNPGSGIECIFTLPLN